jgi:ATP/maltotriose-dependent transcriptional regulator MalT/DNA-binding SARP family transcriptional activator
MVAFLHKITVPQRPTTLVSRPRLVDALLNSRHQRLITLVAPAGFGKTSLLIDFATNASEPVCWYSLDRFDGDPWVFIEYLTASLTQGVTNALPQTTALLARHGRVALSDIVMTITREIVACGHDFTLIIDDWHLVNDVSEIVGVIDQLLTRCPNCHIVLASRIYPSLPDMMLLVARRQMSGLDEQRLRFTPEETLAVLAAEYHTVISLTEATQLTEQANGWITGILLSYQPNMHDLATATPVTDRQVYRFFVEQVFNRQPADIQSFLLDSALLDQISADQCKAFLQRSDGAAIINYLLKQHLFAHEVKAGVVRYHPLFREFLIEHYRCVDADRYHQQVGRVAAEYERQRQWNQAFDHYHTIGDIAALQRVMHIGGEEFYTYGRLETLERWFVCLSLDQLTPRLLCLKAGVLIDRGQLHEAQVLVDLAETRPHQPEDEPVVLLLQAQLARTTGRYEQAQRLGQHVYEQAHEPVQQVAALQIIASCHQRLGNISLAIEHLQTALAIERQRGDLYRLAQLQHDLGMCYEALGALQDAEHCYTNESALWTTLGNTGKRALALNNSGVAQHLAGRYQEAHTTLQTALRDAQDAAMPIYAATILASLGDIYSDLALWPKAAAAYESARKLGGSAYLASYLELATVRLALRQRQVRAATLALQQISESTLQRQPNKVWILRSMLAVLQGDSQQANEQLQQMITELESASAESFDALVDLARVYLWYAKTLVGVAPSDSAALITALERATQIGQQLGHNAFLIAELLPLRDMLHRAAAAGWDRASDWLIAQQDILLIAHLLDRDDDRPVLVIRTLGNDWMTLNGEPVEPGWLKAREVLYFLLEHTAGATAGVTTEAIREAIWPDLEPQRSRDALKTAIYQLRTLLPRDFILLHGRQRYAVNNEALRLDYDVAQFRALIELDDMSETLFDAIDLYRGPYLPWSDNAWSVSIRTYLEQCYLQTLRILAEREMNRQAYRTALMLYQRILAVDILDESAHAGIMRCNIALGNRAAAIEQYRRLQRILHDELGLDLDQDSEAEQLYSRIVAA